MTRWAVITLRDQIGNGRRINTLWARGEGEEKLREVVQYFLDSASPEAVGQYLIMNLDTGVTYDLAGVAVHVWGMHRRSFDERMRG